MSTRRRLYDVAREAFSVVSLAVPGRRFPQRARCGIAVTRLREALTITPPADEMPADGVDVQHAKRLRAGLRDACSRLPDGPTPEVRGALAALSAAISRAETVTRVRS